MKWFMRQHCSVHVSALLVGLAVNKLSAEDWSQIEKLEPSAYEQTTLSKNCMLLRMELFKSRCDTCTHTHNDLCNFKVPILIWKYVTMDL